MVMVLAGGAPLSLRIQTSRKKNQGRKTASSVDDVIKVGVEIGFRWIRDEFWGWS